MTEWRADVLGAGFACTDLDLGSDEEGPLSATLVRSLPEPRGFVDRLLGRRRPLEGVDVLYVHGWSDYFFQRDLAAFWTERGARFFALDLRKYGRSLREGQTPGYIDRLEEYDLEIGLALDVIRTDGGTDPTRKLVLFGHSTGGLVLSLWAGRHPNQADALVLNSPWLEFQLSTAGRQLLVPLVSFGARFKPKEVTPQLDYGFYTRAQHEVGPQDELAVVDPRWRPERSHSVATGWLHAILAGHEQVSRGLGIEIPIAVLLSERFAVPLRWSEELTRADTVLDVDAVARSALRLGSSVTIERVTGGLHDLFLSAQGPRADAYARLQRWLVGWRAETVHEAPRSAAPGVAEPDRLGS